MAKVTIKSLLSIKELEFDVPEAGVWGLAGRNGAGKSSLLAALWRIGSSEAFRTAFPSSSNERLDSFTGTEITYATGEQEVTYRRTKKRWPPTPRKNALSINDFEFELVIFIGADAERVSPTPKDFDPRKNRGASKFIKDGLKEVFGTEKFVDLKVVNVSRGRMTPAYILPGETISGQRHYFSEKNFSLGELCVLKMLAKLDKIGEQKALILIDEMDMALHPVAQVGLFQFLQRLSDENGHMVIISTHSPAIIKEVPPRNLIFLDPQADGTVSVISTPDKGMVLRGVSGDIHLREGSRVYCEDEMARSFIMAAHAKWLAGKNKNAKSFHVMTSGSWTKVLDAGHADGKDGSSHFSVLDADVTDQHVTGHVGAASKTFNWGRLPVTPELCIAEYCRDKPDQFVKELHADLIRMAASSFGEEDVKNALPAPDEHQEAILAGGQNDQATRNTAKSYFKAAKKQLSSQFSVPEEQVESALIKVVVQQEFKSEKSNEWKALFGKMYRALD